MTKQGANNYGVSPRNRWYSIKMANRIPEVDKERKLTEINRYHAQFKRDLRIEEQRLWDMLFENDNILRASLSKYSLEDILEKKVPLARQWEENEEDPLPNSEVYRQFIIFKALTMRKLFGHKANASRPKYRDLYKSEQLTVERNQRNFTDLMDRYRAKSKTEREKAVEILKAGTPDLEESSSNENTGKSRRRSRHSIGKVYPIERQSVAPSSPDGNFVIMTSPVECKPEALPETSGGDSPTLRAKEEVLKLPPIQETGFLVTHTDKKFREILM